jgi:protein required for attachment to host cells
MQAHRKEQKMKSNWVIVANASNARILEDQGEGALAVLHTFTHPQSRSKGSELSTDKAGMEKSDSGFGGGAAFQPRTDVRQKEHAVFARELAAHLEHAALQGAFGSVALFASNPFLGELKSHLGSATQRLVGSTHDLDLTSFGLAELEQRVARALAVPHGAA